MNFVFTVGRIIFFIFIVLYFYLFISYVLADKLSPLTYIKPGQAWSNQEPFSSYPLHYRRNHYQSEQLYLVKAHCRKSVLFFNFEGGKESETIHIKK